MSKKSRANEKLKKEKQVQQSVSIEQIEAAQEWFAANEHNLHEDVRVCLKALLESALKGKLNRAAALASFQQLLIAWGFKASSEKTKKAKPSAEEKEAKKASRYLARLKRELLEAHEYSKQKRLAMEAQNIDNSRENDHSVNTSGASVDETDHQTSIDPLNPAQFGAEFQNPDERAKGDKILDLGDSEKTVEAMEADMNTVAELGQDTAVPMESSEEKLFPAIPLPFEKAEVSFLFSDDELQENFPGSKNISRETYRSTNYDFVLQVQELSVSTEIARDRENNVSLSAAPPTFALKGFQITLRAMVNLVLLSVVFLLPLHRISRLLGNIKIFHRSNISRYLGEVASRSLPVYLHLLQELAQAEHIWGDASPTRVNEVERVLSNRKEWLNSGFNGPPKPFPWERPYHNTEATKDSDSEVERSEDDAESVPSLVSPKLFEELGYHFRRTKSNKEITKIRHQTIVVHGRTDKKDPHTHIVIFRSCLGDVGNVLDKMLLARKKGKPLTLQSDHSSANLPQDHELLKHVQITWAGCLAHLRRPFKRHYDQDPASCENIIGMMDHVFHNENLVKAAGKNEVNTLAMRQRWSVRFLEYIHMELLSKIELKTWSDQTPLGKAARSYIKHFKKLGPILMDPYLEFTNNISERLLRPEKLAQGSSYFRDTIEGRARFDVLRSLHQTCVCAQIPFGVYLLFLLKTDPKLVQMQPSKYTPLAVKEFLKKDPIEEKDLLSALLSNF